MRLLTPEAAAVLPPLRSQEKVADPIAVLKFFCGSWTWYAVEGSLMEYNDLLCFGLVDGDEQELGYFSLTDLQSVRGPLGVGVERDLYFEPTPLSRLRARSVNRGYPMMGREGG